MLALGCSPADRDARTQDPTPGPLSFVVGAGLMALIFFSHRRGYDEEAHRQERPTLGPGKDDD